MLRRRIPTAALIAAAIAATAGPAAAQPPMQDGLPRYVGYLGDGAGRAYHLAQIGGLHKLILTDGTARTGRYRVCLRGGATNLKRCWRRVARHGHGALDVSRLLAMRGGPGLYEVAWRARGRRVATWRFRLYREGQPRRSRRTG